MSAHLARCLQSRREARYQNCTTMQMKEQHLAARSMIFPMHFDRRKAEVNAVRNTQLIQMCKLYRLDMANLSASHCPHSVRLAYISLTMHSAFLKADLVLASTFSGNSRILPVSRKLWVYKLTCRCSTMSCSKFPCVYVTQIAHVCTCIYLYPSCTQATISKCSTHESKETHS